MQPHLDTLAKIAKIFEVDIRESVMAYKRL